MPRVDQCLCGDDWANDPGDRHLTQRQSLGSCAMTYRQLRYRANGLAISLLAILGVGAGWLACNDDVNLDNAEQAIATVCEEWPAKPDYKATLYWEVSALDASEDPKHPVNIRVSGNDYHLSVRNRGHWDGATEEWVRLAGQMYSRNHLDWKWEPTSRPAPRIIMWEPKCIGLVSHQALGTSETRDGRVAWLYSAKESESTLSFPNAQNGQSKFWVDAEGRLLQFQSQTTLVDSAAPVEELTFIATSVYFDIGQANEISNPILAVPIVVHEVRPDTSSENIADLQGATFGMHPRSSGAGASFSDAGWWLSMSYDGPERGFYVFFANNSAESLEHVLVTVFLDSGVTFATPAMSLEPKEAKSFYLTSPTNDFTEWANKVEFE